MYLQSGDKFMSKGNAYGEKKVILKTRNLTQIFVMIRQKKCTAKYFSKYVNGYTFWGFYFNFLYQ